MSSYNDISPNTHNTVHSLCKFPHTNYPTLSSSFCLSGPSSSLLYHLPPSVFQKPHNTTSSSLSSLQDGGRKPHTFRSEVKRFWIWGAAVSDPLQWLLSPCLSVPISAAFLHSWEMCLLPCTSYCQIWSSPCCLGTFQNTHEESIFASSWRKVELCVEWQHASMEERLMKRRTIVSSLAVLYKTLKGNWKTRASFNR